MNWAITLIIAKEQAIEDRLSSIVSYIIKANHFDEFLIHDIDATGQIGNHLTKKMNDLKGLLSINEKELSTLLSEDGQIFELDLFLKNSSEYRFIVRDGFFIDILGNGENLPLDVVGEYRDLDVNLFRN